MKQSTQIMVFGLALILTGVKSGVSGENYSDSFARELSGIEQTVKAQAQKLQSVYRPQRNTGAEYKNIECKYSKDYVDEWGDVKFYLRIDSMNVKDPKTAEISFVTALVLEDKEIWVGKETSLPNMPYNGKKYKNHFKFELKLSRASKYTGSSGADANLIISKEITATEKDQWGAILQKFDAVLDVRYNDHHGDYVPLTCQIRFFE